ncbi:MAG: DUF6580 family putative transport protein [Lysobacterales bacterium]
MSNDAAARWYPRATLVAALILLAALSRLLPHPPNFTPVEAIGLFAGAYLANRQLAFVVPLLAMALADSVLGFHSGIPVIYGLIAFNVWLGFRLGPDPGAGRVAGYGLAAATVFFIVSNFAVWIAADGHYYTQDLAGLVTCYTMALPFFAYTLLGMAVYATVLFGGMALVRRYQPGQLAA